MRHGLSAPAAAVLRASDEASTTIRSAWRARREAAARRAPPVLRGKILYLEKLTVSFP